MPNVRLIFCARNRQNGGSSDKKKVVIKHLYAKRLTALSDFGVGWLSVAMLSAGTCGTNKNWWQ